MPSFAIEAVGEANPFSEASLLHALQAASSSIPVHIKAGTKQLQAWETCQGYYQSLQNVFVSRNLPVEVRYLAIIQLKNGIDKYWRKTAQSALSKDDKQIIRSRLVSSGVNEPDLRICLQNALVTAKVIRYDYPQDWPDAITTCLDAIRATASDVHSDSLQRSLLILLHIIKELSTARIQRSRTALKSVTPEILSVVAALYLDRVQQWRAALEVAEQHHAGLTKFMAESLYAIKAIRLLIIAGYDFPNREEDARSFWSATLSQVDSLIGLTTSQRQGVDQNVDQLVHRHLIQLSKFHLAMSIDHPAAFVLLPSSLDLVRAYWGFARQYSDSYGARSLDDSERSEETADGKRSTAEKLSLNSLLLIRACVKLAFKPAQTFRYKQEQEREEKKMTENTIKQHLLTQSFVEDVLSTVITKFLVLRPSDLKAWAEDAEEWLCQDEQEGEDMQDSIRACSERIVLELCTWFKDILVQPLLQLFHAVARLDNEQVLYKEAVYNAVGLAAPVLQTGLNFDSVLLEVLVPEAQKNTPGFNILRRRIAILTAQWTLVRVADESRPAIYAMFHHLLKEQAQEALNDEVVRISAGWQLKKVVDDFEFRPADFAPFADEIIARLMSLVTSVEQTAVKIALVETISVLIERFDHRIEPYADRIVAILPELWQLSGNEHLMKLSILALLSRLINALKHSSARFHNMVIPIIQNILQPDSDLRYVLIEETLDLWRSVIVQSVAPATTEILSLLPTLISYLEEGYETVRELLQIAEAYLFLAPQQMLQEAVRRSLVACVGALIVPRAQEGINGMACVVLELIIRLAESLGGEAAVQTVLSDMAHTGVLKTLVHSLYSAWQAHGATGPKAPTSDLDGPLETDYLSVLARLILVAPNEVLAGLSATCDAPMKQDMHWLLEEWFAHLDTISDPSRRKLSALALTRLLDMHDPTLMLNNLQLLMTLWTSIVLELCERDPATASISGGPDVAAVDIDRESDSLVYKDPTELKLLVDGAEEAPEEERRRDSTWHDVVHRAAMPVWIRDKLAAVVARVGGQERFQAEWLVNVDQSVVDGFAKLGVL